MGSRSLRVLLGEEGRAYGRGIAFADGGDLAGDPAARSRARDFGLVAVEPQPLRVASDRQSQNPSGRLRAAAGSLGLTQLDPSDFANIGQALKPNALSEYSSIFSQIGSLSPYRIYEEFDEFSRVATMFLAEDWGLGMGLAIVAMSALIKGVFIPIQLKMVVAR